MIKKKFFGRKNVKMKIKTLITKNFYEIETEEDEVYRRMDNCYDWEKWDNFECEWNPVEKEDELNEIEQLFQNYLRWKEICKIEMIKEDPFDTHFKEMEIQHKALLSFNDVKSNNTITRIDGMEKRISRILKGILFVLVILFIDIIIKR
jgi:hypothetical protein